MAIDLDETIGLLVNRVEQLATFGIEVDDVEDFAQALSAAGGEIVSAPGKLPVKFRAPGGPLAEVVPRDRYKKTMLATGTHGPVVE